MRASRGTCGLTAALVFMVSSALAADFRSTFVKGVKAYRGKNFGEAILLFQQAIQLQPNETGEKITISGGDAKPYTPHHLIVISYYQAKLCPDGERQRLLFEAQGALRPEDREELLDYRSRCSGLGPVNPS